MGTSIYSPFFVHKLILISTQTVSNQQKFVQGGDYTSPFPSSSRMYTGLLAPSPVVFFGMIDIVRLSPTLFTQTFSIVGIGQEFTITNRGIRMCLPIQRLRGEEDGPTYYLTFLACGRNSSNGPSIIAIHIQSVPGNVYARIHDESNMKGLFEVPINAIVHRDINPISVHCIGNSDDLIDSGIQTRNIDVDVRRAKTVLQPLGLTVHDDSWKNEISTFPVSRSINEAGHREMFFVAQSYQQPEFMVVMTQIVPSNAFSGYFIGVRTVALHGPDHALYGFDPQHAQRPRDIYNEWRRRAVIQNLGEVASAASATMSNGQEIMFSANRISSTDLSVNASTTGLWCLTAVVKDLSRE